MVLMSRFGRPSIRAPVLNGRSTLADAANAPEKDHRAHRPSNPFCRALRNAEDAVNLRTHARRRLAPLSERRQAARTRWKKPATLASRSCARADSRSVQPPISPTAAARLAGRLLDRLDLDRGARRVAGRGLRCCRRSRGWWRPAASTAAAIEVETVVSSWMLRRSNRSRRPRPWSPPGWRRPAAKSPRWRARSGWPAP